jgi:CBS domain-containing protein
MTMLKVLQLIPTLDRSGAEKQMAMLAKLLPRDRFQVEVAALTRLGPLEAELSAAGVPVTVIGKRLRVDPIALYRLARFLKARAFDVVQTWIFAANTYGRVASRMAGIPVVVVAEMAVDLWKGRFERFVDRRLVQWCDRVVGNSEAVVAFYRQLGLPVDRLVMIYSGVEGEEPPVVDPGSIRAMFGFPPGAPLVLLSVMPDDNLHTALRRMTELNIDELPVVDREDPTHLLGLLSRRQLTLSYTSRIESLRSPESRRSVH